MLLNSKPVCTVFTLKVLLFAKKFDNKILMKIPVIFIDGTPGVVGAEELDSYIEKRRILTFRRTDEWVRITSKDALRGAAGKKPYAGQERRVA